MISFSFLFERIYPSIRQSGSRRRTRAGAPGAAASRLSVAVGAGASSRAPRSDAHRRAGAARGESRQPEVHEDSARADGQPGPAAPPSHAHRHTALLARSRTVSRTPTRLTLLSRWHLALACPDRRTTTHKARLRIPSPPPRAEAQNRSSATPSPRPRPCPLCTHSRPRAHAPATARGRAPRAHAAHAAADSLRGERLALP